MTDHNNGPDNDAKDDAARAADYRLAVGHLTEYLDLKCKRRAIDDRVDQLRRDLLDLLPFERHAVNVDGRCIMFDANFETKMLTVTEALLWEEPAETTAFADADQLREIAELQRFVGIEVGTDRWLDLLRPYGGSSLIEVSMDLSRDDAEALIEVLKGMKAPA